MGITIMPGADRSRWYAGRYPGVVWGNGPDVIVLHTTETVGLPGYRNGATATNCTIGPKYRKTWQHFPINMSSRGLVDSAGGVATNRARAFQVEILGYSDRRIAQSIGRDDLWVGNFTHEDYLYLAKQLAPIVKSWNIPFRIQPRYTRNPRYGTRAAQRMTYSEWRAFSGWCYHAGVPENSHWDTGALDIPRLMQLTKQIVGGTVTPPPDPKPVPGVKYTVKSGDNLTAIADKYGVKLDDILAANPFIKDKNHIQVGWVIVIPGGSTPKPDPKPKPKPQPKFPKVGDNKVWPDYVAWGQRDSDSVRCVQQALIQKGHKIPAGATGFFGQQTKAAVKSIMGGGSGLVGPNTVRTILSGTPYQLQSGFGRNARKWNGGKVYSGWTFYGNRGSDSVRNVQQRLIDLGHGIPAGPTGNFFGQTKNAVMSFQRSVGLAVDGIVGPNTLRALFVAPKQHYLIVWGK